MYRLLAIAALLLTLPMASQAADAAWVTMRKLVADAVAAKAKAVAKAQAELDTAKAKLDKTEKGRVLRSLREPFKVYERSGNYVYKTKKDKEQIVNKAKSELFAANKSLKDAKAVVPFYTIPLPDLGRVGVNGSAKVGDIGRAPGFIRVGAIAGDFVFVGRYSHGQDDVIVVVKGIYTKELKEGHSVNLLQRGYFFLKVTKKEETGFTVYPLKYKPKD